MFIGHKTRRSTTKREEGGVSNERIPPCVGKLPIVGLEEEIKEVSLKKPQVLPEPQEPKVPSIPQAPFIKGDMTDAKLRVK